MLKTLPCLTVILSSLLVACGGAGQTGVVSSSSSSVPNGNPSAEKLVISEIVAKSGLDDYLNGNDWIELKNAGNQALNLSQYSIKDSGSESAPLPSVVVAPGEYYIVQATDEAPLDGGAYVPFKLGSEDFIELQRDNVTVDSLQWLDGDAKQGRSFGRLNGKNTTLYPTPLHDNVPYILFSSDDVFTVKIQVESGGWDAMMARPKEEQYYKADMTFNGALITEVGFRTKGQGSLNTVSALPASSPSAHRHGFKIDVKEYKDQKFMGMKKLVLNNSFSDPSMMRDVMAYKLMRDAGVPAPETSFVDLWVNDEHLGLYQLIEAIDTEFLEKNFIDDKENDFKGDLYKGELFTTLNWVDDQPRSYASLELKTNEETLGTPEESVNLIRFLDSINHTNTLNYVDTDIMVRYLAASVLNGNMDSHIGPTANNFYLYHHVSTDTFTLLPWDYNLAYGMWGDGVSGIGGGFGGGFGGGGFGGGAAPSCRVLDHVIDNPVNDTSASRPLIDRLLEDPAVKNAYHAQLQSLLNTAFNPRLLETEIMRMADLIDPYVKADPTKFFTYEEWRSSLTTDMPENTNIQGGRGAGIYGPAPGLIPYIRERATIVQRQLDGSAPSSNNGDGSACPL